MPKVHTTPACWAVLEKTRARDLDRFAALHANPRSGSPNSGLTAAVRPFTRAGFRRALGSSGARLSFDAPVAFRPCSAKGLSALPRGAEEGAFLAETEPT